jgi:hypothetical protein
MFNTLAAREQLQWSCFVSEWDLQVMEVCKGQPGHRARLRKTVPLQIRTEKHGCSANEPTLRQRLQFIQQVSPTPQCFETFLVQTVPACAEQLLRAVRSRPAVKRNLVCSKPRSAKIFSDMFVAVEHMQT